MTPLPVAVIGAGPVGLVAAAHLVSDRYAGRRVAVVGSGHSAFNTLLDLVVLAGTDPGTTGGRRGGRRRVLRRASARARRRLLRTGCGGQGARTGGVWVRVAHVTLHVLDPRLAGERS
jgi:hypothetical protein